MLGEPDLGLLTPPEMARKAGLVCSSVPGLPLLADADTGGGGVLNVQRTIRQMIAAGCKGEGGPCSQASCHACHLVCCAHRGVQCARAHVGEKARS